jgi:hypothetical protein
MAVDIFALMQGRHSPGLSRDEIETLCILHAVGPDGCSVAELPVRLGISPTLAAHVVLAAAPLVDRGWLAREGDRMAPTEAGRERLTLRLSELGVVP